MEKADDLIDRVFETKQHIEYLRKDILSTTRRQQNFMGQLFELYKSKDRDAEDLRMRLYAMSKEKEFI
jgi:hypothetical protein